MSKLKKKRTKKFNAKKHAINNQKSKIINNLYFHQHLTNFSHLGKKERLSLLNTGIVYLLPTIGEDDQITLNFGFYDRISKETWTASDKDFKNYIKAKSSVLHFEIMHAKTWGNGDRETRSEIFKISYEKQGSYHDIFDNLFKVNAEFLQNLNDFYSQKDGFDGTLDFNLWFLTKSKLEITQDEINHIIRDIENPEHNNFKLWS